MVAAAPAVRWFDRTDLVSFMHGTLQLTPIRSSFVATIYFAKY